MEVATCNRRQGRLSSKWKIAWSGVVLYSLYVITLAWLDTRHAQNSAKKPATCPHARGQRHMSQTSDTIHNHTPKEHNRIMTTTPEREVRGWERNVLRDPTKYIEPFKDTTTISGQNICGNRNITLAIIVTTQPSSFWQRKLVRETWASRNFSHVRIGFLLGLSTNRSVQILVEQESEQFRDIIQENLIDTYNNLTLKSILLLKWFIRYCRTSPFLMKCDANTFVDVTLLMRHLVEYYPKGILMGYACLKCKVWRVFNKTYYAPKYLFSDKTYPNFLLGNSYIMSMDVAVKLYSAALRTPVFHLEDVYITGICARAAGVKPKHFPGSAPYVWNIAMVCTPERTMCHPILPDGMQYLWKQRNPSPRLPELGESNGTRETTNDSEPKQPLRRATIEKRNDDEALLKLGNSTNDKLSVQSLLKLGKSTTDKCQVSTENAVNEKK